MANRRLSELMNFHGKAHAEAFVKRGQNLCPDINDAPVLMMFGLIDHLIELGVLDESPPLIKENDTNVE